MYGSTVSGTATTSIFQPGRMDKHFTCTRSFFLLAARLALAPGWLQLGFEGPAKKWPRFESDRFAYTRASVLSKVVVLRAREHRFCRPPCRAGLGMGLPQALLAAPRGIPRATRAGQGLNIIVSRRREHPFRGNLSFRVHGSTGSGDRHNLQISSRPKLISILLAREAIFGGPPGSR